MFAALLYLYSRSIVNRLLLRFRRLKEPKYLFGGIVGALYFYFYFFRYLFSLPGGTRRVGGFASVPGANLALYESIGAALFLIAIVLAWLLPHERTALAFSEAEVAFLFPAPITRRSLIHFKLLRSQGAILFTTLILMLVTNRFGGRFWIHAAGWWLILSTINLHLLGSSFARTQLMDRGLTNWRRRGLILFLVTATTWGIIVWARRSLRLPDLTEIHDLQSLQDYLQTLLTSGPLRWLLYPFRLVVRPYLAPDGLSFLWALIPALGVMLAHYWWVAHADVAFEEASVEASRKTAKNIAAVRSGNLQTLNPKAKGRRAPFKLASTGTPTIALLWKNLISAGQAFTPRLWLIVGLTALMVCGFLAQRSERSDLLSALGLAAAMLVVWSLFIGPQLLRQDLRQDLQLADILKMYPLRGWEVVLGEMLAPAAILTAVQWLLLLISALLLWSAPTSYLTRPTILSIAVSAILMTPVLNLIILQIPNAAVVLFPAWFQQGKERSQGIEVTGQRIIAVFAQLLVFLFTLIPASVTFGIIFYFSQQVIGRSLGIVLASSMSVVVLAVEAGLGIMLIGRLVERFDLSAELPLT